MFSVLHLYMRRSGICVYVNSDFESKFTHRWLTKDNKNRFRIWIESQARFASKKYSFSPLKTNRMYNVYQVLCRFSCHRFHPFSVTLTWKGKRQNPKLVYFNYHLPIVKVRIESSAKKLFVTKNSASNALRIDITIKHASIRVKRLFLSAWLRMQRISPELSK